MTRLRRIFFFESRTRLWSSQSASVKQSFRKCLSPWRVSFKVTSVGFGFWFAVNCNLRAVVYHGL